MKLHEEFREYETMWEGASTKPVMEASGSRKAYNALMDIQARLSNIHGWTTIDVVQDDDYHMTIKYDLADDAYVWYGPDANGDYEYTSAVEKVAKRCEKIGVSMDIVENDSVFNNYYDIRVYLRYEG